MSLSEERPEGLYLVRWVRPDRIAVGAREFDASFLLTPDTTIPWPPRTLEQIDADALGAILALQPSLVLLGTGARQHFPAPRLMAQFLQRGIGLEAMDNAAAGRTFNLLAGEGRRVLAAFLLG